MGPRASTGVKKTSYYYPGSYGVPDRCTCEDYNEMELSREVEMYQSYEDRNEVIAVDGGQLTDEYVKFEASVESLAYAIGGNEDVQSNIRQICRETIGQLQAKLDNPTVAVYTNGTGIGYSWGQFILKGTWFT